MHLHPSWITVRTTILASAKEPSFDELVSILIASSPASVVASDVTVKTEEEEPDLTLAMAARSGGRFVGSGGSYSGRGSSGAPHSDENGFRWCSPTGNDQCRRCGRVGHISDRCIFDMPPHIKDWVTSGPPRHTAHTTELATFTALPVGDHDSDSDFGDYNNNNDFILHT